eukprot:UN20917
MPLSQPFLHSWGDEWYNNAPRHLTMKALRDNYPKNADKEIIILSSVLPDATNMGGRIFTNSILTKVGDVEIHNLDHLKETINK